MLYVSNITLEIDTSYTTKEAIRSWSDKAVLIGLYLRPSLLRDILKVNLLHNKLQAGIKSRSF